MMQTKPKLSFPKFHSSIVLQNLTHFKNFDKLNDRLDKFYFEDIGLKGFPEFENVVVMICVWVTRKLVLKGVPGLSIIITII